LPSSVFIISIQAFWLVAFAVADRIAISPPPGRRPAGQVHLPPVQQQRPRVGPVGTGQDLHQGRLARTVLAHQAVGLAGAQLQAHVPQCAHGTEGLADVS
jgi:hypothetical protein